MEMQPLHNIYLGKVIFHWERTGTIHTEPFKDDGMYKNRKEMTYIVKASPVEVWGDGDILSDVVSMAENTNKVVFRYFVPNTHADVKEVAAEYCQELFDLFKPDQSSIGIRDSLLQHGFNTLDAFRIAFRWKVVGWEPAQ